MAVLDVIIGYVRGLKGDTGETGATGATGEAATISVGTVSTAAYGQQAQVTNVGTSGAAVFDFVIPEGKPGEVLADMSNLTNNTITASTSEFPVPAVGDTGATLWGKVVKFFSDIRAAVNAKIDSSKITTSLGVTATGSVADATVSKVLNDKITTLNDSFSNAPMLSFRGEILTQANQITRSALASLPLGTYIVQCATAPSDFPYQTAYGVLLHYGSLLNYHHIIFTTGGAILYLDFSGATPGESWRKVSEAAISANASGISALQTTVNGHTTSIANNASAISANTNAINSLIAYKDISVTIQTSGGAAQINSASGYSISKDNFLSAYVIGTNSVNARIHTYNDLLYVKLYTDTGTNVAPGTYMLRCLYVPRGINAAS